MAGVVQVAERTGGQSAPELASEQPAVEALDLIKEYETGTARRRALDCVTLTVPRGRFVSIMGPSGSGKSTLLHLLGGLDRPTSGDVFLDGRSLSRLDDRETTLLRRRAIGFVFQAYNLVPVLTVAENVGLPLAIDGRRNSGADARVADVLALVGLADLAGALPGRLSGGEQQRTAIARALVANPTLVLADEPTGNLDSATGSEILSVLRDAQRELGHTVVVVTHDPKVAAAGDEVYHLRDGRVAGHLDLSRARGRRAADRVVSWLTEG